MAKDQQIDLSSPEFYINRELSMLAFQHRVFAEAKDAANPVLERVKFFSIVHSNMDEFFMVRVGGLNIQKQAGLVNLSQDGLMPAEQLVAIRKEAGKLFKITRKYWQETLAPLLDLSGIHIKDYDLLTDKQKENIDDYFEISVFPVLTPLAFDPGHPFPHISNLSLNLAVLIEDIEGHRHFARIKVPDSLPRLVPIKRSSGGVRKDGTVPHDHYFIWLEQLIAANLQNLFPGMKILEAHPFRVIRNADMEIQELEADDLLEMMEESVRKRRFGMVVQLAVNKNMPDYIKDLLIENLRVDKNDVFALDGPLGLSATMELTNIERYDLKDAPFVSNTPRQLRHDGQISGLFSAISSDDVILHHPYDSFDPVIEFLQAAAKDPNVLAIKQTLYRVEKNSPVVKELLRARRDYGKQVAVLVELKARFDEQSNITWAKRLEEEGVHVIYGLLGLKTHCKIAMVVRKEGDDIRRYVHLGTGNYNAVTATLYEDIGMFTVDSQIGADASDLFNYLTGYSAKTDYQKLLIAPINLRTKLTELIEREITNKNNGEGGHLIFKMNALVDARMIRALYKASQAGVKVDLIVRGICCLRPGVPGVSENIRVISILGRFLEHSRIYCFHNMGKEEIYMGSADLMPRNLDRRVEVLYPVQNPEIIRHIRDEVLELMIGEDIRAWLLDLDGKYRRITNARGARDVQEQFIEAVQAQG